MKTLLAKKPPSTSLASLQPYGRMIQSSQTALKGILEEKKEHFWTTPKTLIEGITRRFLHTTQNYVYIMLDRREAHKTEEVLTYIRQGEQSPSLKESLFSPYFLVKREKQRTL